MGKRWSVLILLGLILSGCAAEETFETVADELVVSASAQRRDIYVELPGEAASPAVESDAGRLYLCGDYDIRVQILEGGDINGTVRSLTGFDMEDLTVVQTQRDQLPCYEFVFSSAGETGDQVGRGMIIDDGSWHYCLTVLGDAEKAAGNQVFWEDMFRSFRLA